MGVCGRRLDKVRLSALSGGWVRSRFEPLPISGDVESSLSGEGAVFWVGLRPPSPRLGTNSCLLSLLHHRERRVSLTYHGGVAPAPPLGS